MPYGPKKRHRNKRPPKERKPTGDQRFYQSKPWKLTRARWLSEHPICQVHAHVGLLEAGVVVDHIIGIREEIGGARHDPANLATMCADCHNYKSGKETHNPYLVAWQYAPTGKVCKDKDKLFELLSERI